MKKANTADGLVDEASAISPEQTSGPAAFRAVVPERFPRVVVWRPADERRILPVPPDHWLLIEDEAPFRATLQTAGLPQQAASIAVREGHVACFAPGQPAGDAELTLERNVAGRREARALIRFLAAGPCLKGGNEAAGNDAGPLSPLERPLVLLTNGIGGMARLGVDFGAVKSKYDCLLGASLNPRVPVDRHIFAKRARVWVNADGFLGPLDLRSLASFEPGPPAVWHFIANAGDGRTMELTVTVAMAEGRNTTLLRFSRPMTNPAATRPLPDTCDVRLTVRVDIEDRNFHWETKHNGGADHHFSSNTRALADRPGFAFTPAADRSLRVFTNCGVYHPQPEWSENIPHVVEQSRGQTGSGDAYSPGWFELPLSRGNSVTIVVCADATDPGADEIRRAWSAPEGGVEKEENPRFDNRGAKTQEDPFGRQLAQAARAFVVRRDDGVTVIAGYPWFLDWGRDSLICARGLLATGMLEQVKQLLVTFGRFERDGTLPNTIHGDDASNRDTSDAPLWYGFVCEEAAALAGEGFYETRVDAEGRTIAGVLAGIAAGYAKGTPNGIRMDAASALVWSPSHFTWMDTNYPAATPREGYPVEIQVLWVRLLRQLARMGGEKERARWSGLADKALASLQKYFWLEERGYFADVLLAKSGQAAAEAVADNALRSNGLFAVSLGLVTGPAARRCVDAALRHLVVPGALRTLAPLPVSPPLPVYGAQGQLLNNPTEPYWGRYEGDEDTRRKPAYHNGTAWTWTFPVFCEALARAWDCAPEAVAAARAYLGSMDRLLMQSCLGQIPEIVDGDAPHTQRGCDAQAWGVTEALRVWRWLNTM